ncbi:hypothetical protein [Streptomyces sp. NBC_01306]|uniref:hypothetical protein n=1 Tax=Streptomyces sp. NBC_01306 TaxID=2903819 RepID=UPI00224CC9B2|nr:hypothetical protein [Streptomyces sp. NBC_01306]MCX4729333.1 hypothetical protein [Streptomyces sp. NBC_01306]
MAVTGDVHWAQGDMDRAAAAYEAARNEAEDHGVAGERATSQAQRAFVLAFTDPGLAADELDLAQQLLTGLDLRATALTTQIASLIADAGSTGDLESRASTLQAEIGSAGITSAEMTLELAVCFHHAVLDTAEVTTGISRLRDVTPQRRLRLLRRHRLLHGRPPPQRPITRTVARRRASCPPALAGPGYHPPRLLQQPLTVVRV